jgi:hypothetical protein
VALIQIAAPSTRIVEVGSGVVTADHVARSDCERIRPGLLAQPVNAVSSLAYCAVGAWVWHRSQPQPTAGWRIVAAASVAVGLGSAAYHGPGGRGSRILHDTSNVALAIAIAAKLLSADRPPRPELLKVAAVASISGIAVHHASRTDRILCRPDTLLQGHAAWHLLGALAVLTTAEAHQPAPQASSGC